ncbi:MAG: sulfite exporter TauE/SafE family protein [Planctomycetota bacterium]|nr:sulfite exporter TauE/SafE family protein [Planctomycetota bacterium]
MLPLDPSTSTDWLVGVVLIAVGFIGGTGAGLLGIGGGLIIIPLLTILFGPHQHAYQCAALLTAVAIGASSASRHLRSGTANRPLAFRTIMWSAPTAALAALLATRLDEGPLRKTFALMLFFVGVWECIRLIRHAPNGDIVGTPPRVSRAWIIGAPMGTLSGLFGIGGGIVAVPLLHGPFRLPMRASIATSAVAVLGTVIIAASTTSLLLIFGKNAASQDHVFSIPIWATLLGGSGAVGAWLGAHLTHALPVRVVKGCFLAILAFFAWRMWIA